MVLNKNKIGENDGIYDTINKITQDVNDKTIGQTKRCYDYRNGYLITSNQDIETGPFFELRITGHDHKNLQRSIVDILIMCFWNQGALNVYGAYDLGNSNINKVSVFVRDNKPCFWIEPIGNYSLLVFQAINPKNKEFTVENVERPTDISKLKEIIVESNVPRLVYDKDNSNLNLGKPAGIHNGEEVVLTTSKSVYNYTRLMVEVVAWDTSTKIFYHNKSPYGSCFNVMSNYDGRPFAIKTSYKNGQVFRVESLGSYNYSDNTVTQNSNYYIQKIWEVQV